ncbi:hypothetical protein PNEG_02424 [Pneumocystis murina B123]|uniref:Endo-1,3(4)-beta-glucanase 1 carbohydrate binding domain-containing protein n=1 Tax=Pneumocystis murina (strain B123) TaxID=1069680 RepID=M7NKB6_PNEMU|nr:hypothetical protein PNEG_02424 [Pneumocystis murina B123]EMR09078.1 hypothetical protein PNEG_02424 [Pneumocystis murina B123]
MVLNVWIVLFLMSIFHIVASAPEQIQRDKMILCGAGYFDPRKYTCFDGLACPIIGGTAFLRCSNACYSPLIYHCLNGKLHQGPEPPEKQVPPKYMTSTPTSTLVFSGTADKLSQTPWKPSFGDKTEKKKGNANHDMTTFSIFGTLCIIGIIGFILAF